MNDDPTPPGDVPVIGLVVEATSAERRVLEEWAATQASSESPMTLVDLDKFCTLAEEYVDALVVPVKVSYVPTVSRQQGSSRVSELALLATPKRPATWLARTLAARSPGRRRVLTGDPATLGELRRRFATVVAGDDVTDDDQFVAFVRRAAIVALERTERGLIGDRYKVPHAVAEEIMARSQFRAELDALAERLEITRDEARRRAGDALDELVAIQTRAGVDMFYALMNPLHSATWKVKADDSRLQQLRDLNKRHALVFLPSHRSYVDTMVLGDVLARFDFPRNHVMGGANLRIWPISDLARRAGVVFIRRSFGDDAIYKAVVQEYFGFLLAKRFNLEWYFEGGRSRTGKLRPPRYGLLRYVASAVTSGRVEDVYLVPTSITYDRLHEVAMMAAEQAGAPKQAEGLKWLASYARSQRRTSGGDAYVSFGEPIAVRPALPRGDDPAAERAALHKLAFEVAVGINNATPITPNGLLALTLLGVRDQSLTIEQIEHVLAPILDYVRARGVPTARLDRLESRSGLHGVLQGLVRARVVTVYDQGIEPVYAVDRDQHLVAAFYRNNAIHWFVNRAIVELSLLTATRSGAEDGDTRAIDVGWTEAKRIRDHLRFEFFFPDRAVWDEQMRDELALLDPGSAADLITRLNNDADDQPDRDTIDRILTSSGVLMAHRVLRTFFDAQLVVADRLAAWPIEEPVDIAELLKQCDVVGRQMVLQRRLHGMESISKELFTSAVELFTHIGLVKPPEDADPEDLAHRRREARAYVEDLLDRVRAIEGLDARNRAEVTGVIA